MSLKGGPVTRDLLEYIVERFAGPEAELLGRMWTRATAAGLPMIMIAPEQARLLKVLLRAVGARRALDVGTLFGYSAATMALAMGPQGRVVTVDAERRCLDVARSNFEELGLAARIETIHAPALEAMQRMDPDGFDFALVDADKQNYENYLEEAVRLVRPGGLVAFDNAFAFGMLTGDAPPPGHPAHGDVDAIRRFNAALAAHEAVDAIIVPMGDGLALGVVKG